MANLKSVLGRPLPDANRPRNAFDRSSHRVYHLPLGMLCPVWWEPMIAGSHVKLNRRIFQRTADVNTAAFPIIDTHIQYYFVPYRQLMSQWDDFKLNIQDSNSTSLASTSAPASTGMDVPNRVPYFSLNDAATALLNYTTNDVKDIVGMPAAPSSSYLLNLLGYGDGVSIAPSGSPDVNAWPILAYHKIYFDHFRNTTYESNIPRMYNMDFLWSRNGSMKIDLGTLQGNANGSDPNDKALLSMHYVNYRNDYFTNIYPSLNYVQSSPLGNDWTVSKNVLGTASNALSMGVQPSVGTASFGVGLPGLQNFGSSDTKIISVNALRSLFALDKLMRSSAYAPKHAKEQYEARFGIKFRNNPNESIFIGSFMNDIKIGEVTSTAMTQTDSGVTPVGAIGGKGVGYDDFGKNLEFTCQEDGIIMAVQYEMVRSNYRSFGLDSYLVKHVREDYFQPEFENLGLEPVYAQELARDTGQSIVMGYRPRNSRYKLGIDKSYGLFADVDSDMSMFVNHTDVGRIPESSGLSSSWFKVQPIDLNGVMRVDYNGEWETHQFITDCEFGCICNQNMSVHGQPSL